MNRAKYAFLMLSMSLEEAKALLGFSPSDAPTKSEINQAWKRRIFERHPDRGGDNSAAVELNVARDILEGRRKPTYNRGPSVESAPPQPKWTPPKETGTSFDQAKSKAGIPSNVDWYFVTTSQRGKGWYGDESSASDTAWAAYGRTDSHHVFVGVRNTTRKDYFIGGSYNEDNWTIKSNAIAIRDMAKEGASPSWLYGNVVKILKSVGFAGRFNSKVIDAGPWKFDDRLPSGSATSIKHWLVARGEVESSDPSVAGRKHVVEIVYNRASGFGDENAGVTLKLNGRNYDLSDGDYAKFLRLSVNGRRALRAIFGEYYYDGSKKVLTRSKHGKLLLKWFSENMTSLPSDAQEVLAQASAQMK